MSGFSLNIKKPSELMEIICIFVILFIYQLEKF